MDPLRLCSKASGYGKINLRPFWLWLTKENKGALKASLGLLAGFLRQESPSTREGGGPVGGPGPNSRFLVFRGKMEPQLEVEG